MNSNFLTGAATMLLGRSRRFRWLVPAVPLAFAAYRFYKHRKVNAIASVDEEPAFVAGNVLPEPVVTAAHPAPVPPPSVRRRKRSSARTASR